MHERVVRGEDLSTARARGPTGARAAAAARAVGARVRARRIPPAPGRVPVAATPPAERDRRRRRRRPEWTAAPPGTARTPCATSSPRGRARPRAARTPSPSTATRPVRSPRSVRGVSASPRSSRRRRSRRWRGPARAAARTAGDPGPPPGASVRGGPPPRSTGLLDDWPADAGAPRRRRRRSPLVRLGRRRARDGLAAPARGRGPRAGPRVGGRGGRRQLSPAGAEPPVIRARPPWAKHRQSNRGGRCGHERRHEAGLRAHDRRGVRGPARAPRTVCHRGAVGRAEPLHGLEGPPRRRPHLSRAARSRRSSMPLRIVPFGFNVAKASSVLSYRYGDEHTPRAAPRDLRLAEHGPRASPVSPRSCRPWSSSSTS